MASQQRLFWIEDLDLFEPFGAWNAAGWVLIDECLRDFTIRLMAKWNK